MKPRLFLDVDGVLNPIIFDRAPHPAWTDWQTGRASRFRIVWSPSVIRFLHRINDDVDVVWLTSWGDDADEHLAPLLGLPHWPIGGRESFDADGHWWKHDIVRELWDIDQRPFIWLDDDLAYEPGALEWLARLPGDHVLGLSPESSSGLLPVHLDEIERFLTTQQRGRSERRDEDPGT